MGIYKVDLLIPLALYYIGNVETITNLKISVQDHVVLTPFPSKLSKV